MCGRKTRCKKPVLIVSESNVPFGLYIITTFCGGLKSLSGLFLGTIRTSGSFVPNADAQIVIETRVRSFPEVFATTRFVPFFSYV